MRLSLYLGLFSVLIAFLVGVFAIWSWLTMKAAPGWTSILIIMLTFGAMQMFCLAIMGDFGRTYMQTKQRPLFIIKSIHQSQVDPPTANN